MNYYIKTPFFKWTTNDYELWRKWMRFLVWPFFQKRLAPSRRPMPVRTPKRIVGRRAV